MRPPSPICASRWLGTAVLSLALAAVCRGAPVRVTTFDLRPNAAVGATGWSPSFQKSLISEAAATLAEIKPDVILLQDISGWAACEQLAQALRPLEYQVDVCSAFRDSQTGEITPRQSAIFSRSKAYLSWPAAWRAKVSAGALPGGCAFAAIHIDGRNIGFFSAQFGDDSTAKSDAARIAREGAAEQLSDEVARLESWTTNRLQSFVIAGDFNTTPDDPAMRTEQTLPSIEAMGFANAFEGVRFEERVTLPANNRRPGATVDYIFNKGGRPPGHPFVSRGALTEHCAVTYEIDFSLPPLPKPQPSLAGAATKLAPRAARENALLLLGGGVGAVAAIGLIGFVARRRPKATWQLTQSASGLRVADPHSGTIVMTPDERQGFLAEIGRWAKQKIVRRLVSDRSELLAIQHTAAVKVENVNDRLSKIERQIQNRRAEYEARIEALLKELATAREENRELIETRIALIKAQMESEHAKA